MAGTYRRVLCKGGEDRARWGVSVQGKVSEFLFFFSVLGGHAGEGLAAASSSVWVKGRPLASAQRTVRCCGLKLGLLHGTHGAPHLRNSCALTFTYFYLFFVLGLFAAVLRTYSWQCLEDHMRCPRMTRAEPAGLSLQPRRTSPACTPSREGHPGCLTTQCPLVWAPPGSSQAYSRLGNSGSPRRYQQGSCWED